MEKIKLIICIILSVCLAMIIVGIILLGKYIAETRKYKDELKRLDERLANEQSKHTALVNEIDSYKASIDLLKNSLLLKELEIDELTSKTNENSQTIVSQSKTLSEDRDLIIKLRNLNSSQLTQVNLLKGKINKEQQKNQTLSKSIESLKNSLSMKELKIDELTSRINENNQIIASQNKTLSEDQDLIIKLRNLNSSQLTQVNLLKDELNKEQQKNQALSKNIADYSNKINSFAQNHKENEPPQKLQQDINDLKILLANQEKQYRAKLFELESEATRVNEVVQNTIFEINTIEDIFSAYKKDTENKYKSFRNILIEQKRLSSATFAQYDKELSDQKSLINSQQKEIEYYKRILDERDDQSKMIKHLNELRANQNKLNAKLASYKTYINRLKRENDKLLDAYNTEQLLNDYNTEYYESDEPKNYVELIGYNSVCSVGTKHCPVCGEKIFSDNGECPYCGEMF